MRKSLVVVWTLICATLTVLSLPSVPDDVAKWGPLVAWVNGSAARWLLPISGYLGLALLAFFLLHRRQPNSLSFSGELQAPTKQADSPGSRSASAGAVHETGDKSPPLPNNPLPTDLKTQALTLVKKERERRAAIRGGSPLDPALVDDLRYEYSNLREIAAFGANASVDEHREVAKDARSWRLRVQERLQRAHFDSAAKFVFTSSGAHLPLPDNEGSPFVRSLMASLVGASNAQRETQRLIGDRLDRLQALIEALQEPEGGS